MTTSAEVAAVRRWIDDDTEAAAQHALAVVGDPFRVAELAARLRHEGRVRLGAAEALLDRAFGPATGVS